MNTLIKAAAGLALCAVTACAQTENIDLDTLLARNAEAMGGADAWNDMRNIRVELDISEPTFEVQGMYLATRDGSMRIDIHAGDQRVFAEGLHEGQSWQWSPDSGYQGTTEAAAMALTNSVQAPGRFYTLQMVQAMGGKFELVTPDSDSEWKIRGTLQNGSVIDYYLDKDSHRVTREVSRRAFHPDVDPTETAVETRNEEPVWIDGVLRYRKTINTNLDNGEWLGTTQALSIEHNVEIEAGYFSPHLE